MLYVLTPGDLAKSVLLLVAVAVGVSLLILLTCYARLWYEDHKAAQAASRTSAQRRGSL